VTTGGVRGTTRLTAAQANAVYDLLVQHAGASEEGRESFVSAETSQHCTEYRFGGSLGFGGKFWRNAGAWYVTAYPETIEARPEIRQAIDATNRAPRRPRQAGGVMEN